MRKFYLLLTLVIGLFLQSTKAQDVAGFNVTIGANNLVNFTNTSILNGPGDRKAYWSFGDGAQQVTPVLANTQHQYTSAGTFTVCLKIIRYTNAAGTDTVLTSHICKTISLQNMPDSCSANFSDNYPTTSSLTKIFTAQPRHSNNKRPEKICWDFGDGKDTCISCDPAQANNYAVQHTYAQPGEYKVCVKIKYQGGCEAGYCRGVRVGLPGTIADSCKADYSVERLNSSPLGRQFKALTGHSQNKKPVRICWIFGDGKDTCIQYPSSFTGQYVVNHTYAQQGRYEVCVKIFYEGGCEAKKCKITEVILPPLDSCKADFRVEQFVAHPLTRQFIALPSHSQQKRPVKICWYFGDGKDTCIQYPSTTAAGYTVNHTYASPGQYEVCVKIFYDGGCEAKNCKAVILPPPPADTCHVRVFQVPMNHNGLDRAFYAVTTPNKIVEKICWNFGDGTDTCINLSSPLNPSALAIRHHFPAPGVYKVCVKVLYAGGCTAHHCIEVVIRSTTNLCGGYMTDSLIAPRKVLFKGFSVMNSQDQVVSWRWTFGDGSSAVGQEVRHEYAQGGSYEVCLYIKTALGCETRICKKIIVRGNTSAPQLHLSPNPVISTLHAVFQSFFHEQVKITIYNANGIVVGSYTKTAVQGMNTWDFNVSILPAGVYSVIVSSPQQLANALFFKQ